MTQSLDNDSTEKSSQSAVPLVPAVLVITVGNSDIKLGVQVSDDADCELRGMCFPVGVFVSGREMNQWLLDNPNLWKPASASDWVDYETIRQAHLSKSDSKSDSVHLKPLLARLPELDKPPIEVVPEDFEVVFKPKRDVQSMFGFETNRDFKGNKSAKELQKLGLSIANNPSEKDKLQVWLVKAMPVVIELQKKYQIKAVVVFDTCRDLAELKEKGKAHIAKSEHIAAGKLVCDWAANYLELDNCAEESIEPYSNKTEIAEKFSRLLDGAATKQLNGIAFYTRYLKGGMETDGEEDNFPVNRKAIGIIDNVLFALKESVAKRVNEPVTCIYSPGGGFPEYKNQIGAACHLYFDKVNKIVAPQHFDREMLIEDADKYPAPDVSYRFREQAIQLLQHGDYAGAATIAQLVQQQIAIEISGKSNREKEAHYNWRWTQVLLDISHWLQGTLALEREEEIGGDPKHSAHPLHHLVGKHTPYALKVAFRIEAALQQNHIQEAIRYTSDLAEVLIYDYLSLVFSDKDEQGRADYRYFEKSGELTKDIGNKLNAAFNTIELNPAKEMEVAIPNDGLNSVNVDGRAIIKYQGANWLPNTNVNKFESAEQREQEKSLFNWHKLACRLVNYDGESTPLVNFNHSLRYPADGFKTYPADYRNKITHQVLSAEQINEAIATYQAAGLWSDSVSKSKQTNVRTQQESQARFLSQDLVKNVFKPMLRLTTGDVNLLEQYKTLIEQTIQLIYEADIAWREETTVGSM
ncbi:hypothetical protein KIH87_11800 [Paraneptunicella aestuarii]|uniref:hypothetical protein n=1 Tax=Paraneptunicella aestuarii TaxID=2831148 RepID=UPI001E4BFB5C|nr:hypothetical protein [Paraneptunicella aestuarii]UAA37398.1 hypothetical protein KIH87_11800 [Paraneptunicella aestuarii]